MAASPGADAELDIYAGIVEYSHEEVEKLLDTCRRLHADNMRLTAAASELRAQLSAQQKGRELLRRSFSSLLLTARAEIARKDARLAELQRLLDQRQIRASGRDLAAALEREARRLASQRGRVSPPRAPDAGPDPDAPRRPRRSRRSDVVASLKDNSVTVQAANLSFSLATDQVPWTRHRTVQLTPPQQRARRRAAVLRKLSDSRAGPDTRETVPRATAALRKLSDSRAGPDTPETAPRAAAAQRPMPDTRAEPDAPRATAASPAAGKLRQQTKNDGDGGGRSTQTDADVAPSGTVVQRVQTPPAVSDRLSSSVTVGDRLPTSVTHDERLPTSATHDERPAAHRAIAERALRTRVVSESMSTPETDYDRVMTPDGTCSGRLVICEDTSDSVLTSAAASERVPTPQCDVARESSAEPANRRVSSGRVSPELTRERGNSGRDSAPEPARRRTNKGVSARESDSHRSNSGRDSSVERTNHRTSGKRVSRKPASQRDTSPESDRHRARKGRATSAEPDSRGTSGKRVSSAKQTNRRGSSDSVSSTKSAENPSHRGVMCRPISELLSSPGPAEQNDPVARTSNVRASSPKPASQRVREAETIRERVLSSEGALLREALTTATAPRDRTAADQPAVRAKVVPDSAATAEPDDASASKHQPSDVRTPMMKPKRGKKRRAKCLSDSPDGPEAVVSVAAAEGSNGGAERSGGVVEDSRGVVEGGGDGAKGSGGSVEDRSGGVEDSRGGARESRGGAEVGSGDARPRKKRRRFKEREGDVGSSAKRRRRSRAPLQCDDSVNDVIIDVQFCVASTASDSDTPSARPPAADHAAADPAPAALPPTDETGSAPESHKAETPTPTQPLARESPPAPSPAPAPAEIPAPTLYVAVAVTTTSDENPPQCSGPIALTPALFMDPNSLQISTSAPALMSVAAPAPTLARLPSPVTTPAPSLSGPLSAPVHTSPPSSQTAVPTQTPITAQTTVPAPSPPSVPSPASAHVAVPPRSPVPVLAAALSPTPASRPVATVERVPVVPRPDTPDSPLSSPEESSSSASPDRPSASAAAPQRHPAKPNGPGVRAKAPDSSVSGERTLSKSSQLLPDEKQRQPSELLNHSPESPRSCISSASSSDFDLLSSPSADARSPAKRSPAKRSPAKRSPVKRSSPARGDADAGTDSDFHMNVELSEDDLDYEPDSPLRPRTERAVARRLPSGTEHRRRPADGGALLSSSSDSDSEEDERPMSAISPMKDADGMRLQNLINGEGSQSQLASSKQGKSTSPPGKDGKRSPNAVNVIERQCPSQTNAKQSSDVAGGSRRQHISVAGEELAIVAGNRTLPAGPVGASVKQLHGPDNTDRGQSRDAKGDGLVTGEKEAQSVGEATEDRPPSADCQTGSLRQPASPAGRDVGQSTGAGDGSGRRSASPEDQDGARPLGPAGDAARDPSPADDGDESDMEDGEIIDNSPVKPPVSSPQCRSPRRPLSARPCSSVPGRRRLSRGDDSDSDFGQPPRDSGARRPRSPPLSGRRRSRDDSGSDRSPSLRRRRLSARSPWSPLARRGLRGRGRGRGRLRLEYTDRHWTSERLDRYRRRDLDAPTSWSERRSARGRLVVMAERRRRRLELTGNHRRDGDSDDDRPARRADSSARRTDDPERRADSSERRADGDTERRRSRTERSERRRREDDREDAEQEDEDAHLFTPPDRPAGSPPGLTGQKERRLGRYLDAFINNETYCEDSMSRVEVASASVTSASVTTAVAAAADDSEGAVVAVASATASVSACVSITPPTADTSADGSTRRRRRRRRAAVLGDSDSLVFTVAAETGAAEPRQRSESPDDTLERLARQAEQFAAPDALSGEDSEMSLLSFCR